MSKGSLLMSFSVSTAISVLVAQTVLAQTLAFPGAEGFGAYAKGGRGGDVYYVTNLKDSGAGSLRDGIQSATGPRTIVFGVSGLIKLSSSLVVDKDFITIAGQTAPGDGICLRDNSLSISADDVVVRFVRSRLGDDAGAETDAISISDGKNIIVDHCSASWSVDECMSCSTGERGLDNVTVQWTIISEALRNSIHHKGAHSYGALIRGCYGARYSYHHNLFAHNVSRNPRPGNYDSNPHDKDPEGLQFDFRNNVLYNWQSSRPGYDSDRVSVCRYNYVGNYAKLGSNSTPGHLYDAGSKYFRGYYEGNFYDRGIPADQWSLVSLPGSWTQQERADYKRSEPFPSGPIETDTAHDAYDKVLAHAGASLPRRDAVDSRVVSDVRNGTGAIIDHEEDVGGWPDYKTRDAPVDGDKDGMPDIWENAKKLNPVDDADRNGFDLDPHYTNLEVYLNELAARAW
jgi:hypothetical protein